MKKFSILFSMLVVALAITTRAYALHPLAAVIDSSKAVVNSASIGSANWTQYSQASVDGANYFIKQADSISAGTDDAKKTAAVRDLRYYMSKFYVNPGLPADSTYTEDFDGIIKYPIWNTLGGANGIIPSIDNGTLKYNCIGNGSMWFSAHLFFGSQPQPIVLNPIKYPHVSFKAKVATGATYDGFDLDSATITFCEFGQNYQNFKVPVDGQWHDVCYYLPGTTVGGYGGVDAMWLNPGMAEGHFAHEFVGTVWIDDFKVGKAVQLPTTTTIASVIDSSQIVVNAAIIGSSIGQFTQMKVDAANAAIASATSVKNNALVQEQVEKATQNLRNAMKLFTPNIATALNTIFNKDIDMYLNQSDNNLIIKKVAVNGTLKIFSLNGQLVMNQKLGQVQNISISLQHLQSGAYIINFASDQVTATGKISIK